LSESLSVRVNRKRIWGLKPNVFFLGLTSFLTDVSSEMIFTLVPLFLFNVLGAGASVVGLVGGVSESADALLRILSGWVSDRVGRRKPLVVLGYGLSTLAKPFMYLVTAWSGVLAIRFGDRLGKGIRTSSRDALLADSLSSGERGRGFGLHRAMDTAGAVLGLVVTAVIVNLAQGGGLELDLKTYRWLVIVGVIPAVLALVVLVTLVKEKGRQNPRAGVGSVVEVKRGRLGSFDNRFKLFLGVIALFTLGNSSDFFIILRAQNLDVPLVQVVLMLVLFNVVYALTSLPAGMLSDKLGRKKVIAIGWFVYALIYLGFALVSSRWQLWVLFAGYGIYYGIAEGVARAFVADLVPAERRGAAYGLYHGVVGLALLPASLVAGWLWQAVNPAAPFFFGAGLSFLAVLGMVALVREQKESWQNTKG